MLAVRMLTWPTLPLVKRTLSAYAVMVTCLLFQTHTSVSTDSSLRQSLQADMLAANDTTTTDRMLSAIHPIEILDQLLAPQRLLAARKEKEITGFGTSAEDFVCSLLATLLVWV